MVGSVCSEWVSVFSAAAGSGRSYQRRTRDRSDKYWGGLRKSADFTSLDEWTEHRCVHLIPLWRGEEGHPAAGTSSARLGIRETVGMCRMSQGVKDLACEATSVLRLKV